jgi:hypothetical protein
MTGDPWIAFPPRQLTGKPYVYHAYVGHGNHPERTCCHREHRHPETAWRCAEQAARRLNRQ